MKLNFFKLLGRVSIVALFVLILSVVLLHANGFKYDFRDMGLQKTSVIYLDNYFRGKIYLDDELIDDNGPRQLAGLMPAMYLVTIVEDGYHQWQEEVIVFEDIISRVDNVLLVPTSIETFKQKVLSLSEDKQWFLRQGYLISKNQKGSIAYADLNSKLEISDLKEVPNMVVADLKSIGVLKQVLRAVTKDGLVYYYDLVNNGFLSVDKRSFDVYSYRIEANKVQLLTRGGRVIPLDFEGQNISDMNVIEGGGKTFLRVEVIGEEGYRVYHYNDNKFKLIARGIKNGPYFSSKAGFLFLDVANKISLLDHDLVKSSMIARFADEIALHGWLDEKGYFVYSKGKDVFVCSLNMRHNHKLLSASEISVEERKIYYIDEKLNLNEITLDDYGFVSLL